MLTPVHEAEVRRFERERYLISLFMPQRLRAGAAILLAFNLEIAKVRETVSEPLLGQIRLQWWREAIGEIYTGCPVRRHAVVTPLAVLIETYGLTRHHFDRMIDARERDLTDEPPGNLDALKDYAENTAARLIYLMLELTGTHHPAAFQAAKPVGIGYALTGLIRAWPFLIAQRRPIIPHDWVPSGGGDESAIRPPLAADWCACVRRLAEVAEAELLAARPLLADVPRSLRPILLPATAAMAHLTRLKKAQFNPFDPSVHAPDGLMVARLALARVSGRY